MCKVGFENRQVGREVIGTHYRLAKRVSLGGEMVVVVFVTASNRKEAENIASGLLKGRLAACVNMISGVSSFFRWEGKVDKAKETLLIIKTRKALMDKLIKKVKSLHSYEVPEIIALPVISGYKRYLGWVDESAR